MAGEAREHHRIEATVLERLAHLEHIELARRHARALVQRQQHVLERVLLEQEMVAPLILEHCPGLDQFVEQIAPGQ